MIWLRNLKENPHHKTPRKPQNSWEVSHNIKTDLKEIKCRRWFSLDSLGRADLPWPLTW
jgi:hypothetical protein